MLTAPSILDIFFSVEDTFEAPVLIQSKSSFYVKQEALKNCQIQDRRLLVSDGSIKCLGLQIRPFRSKTGSSEQANCPPQGYNLVVAPHDPNGSMTDQICLLWKRLENHERVNGIKSEVPNRTLPLFSKLKSQPSSSTQKKTVARKKLCLSSPLHGAQCKIIFPVVAKDSYIHAKRSKSDSCSENSTSTLSTAAAQKANSSREAACSAGHSSAIPYDLVIFWNVIRQWLFLMY